MVVQRIAGAVDGDCPVQTELFNVVGQGIRDAAAHRIHSLGRVFDHGITHVVDYVFVITQSTHHGVGADATVQHVVTGVADQGVRHCVTGSKNSSGSGQSQLLDIDQPGQAVVDVGFHRVGSLTRSFHHLVFQGINDIGVVPATSRERVGAGTAHKAIVEVGAGQRGCSPIIRDRECASTAIGRAFDSREIHRKTCRANVHFASVATAAGGTPRCRQIHVDLRTCAHDKHVGFHRQTFGVYQGRRGLEIYYPVLTSVNHKGVVTRASRQDILTKTAHQRVITVPATQRVVPRKTIDGIVQRSSLQGI